MGKYNVGRDVKNVGKKRNHTLAGLVGAGLILIGSIWASNSDYQLMQIQKNYAVQEAYQDSLKVNY